LNKCSTEELFSRLQQLDPERTKSIDPHNPRRLVRAIEIASALGAVPTQPSKPLYDAHIFCIQIPPTELRERIRMRLKARLDAGMIEEVRLLHSNGLSYKRMEELGLEYRYIAQHLQGALSYQELTTTLEAKIWQYAKRQLTWLKKDTSIKCGDPDGKAAEEAG
jgi:tRNA dimethylallyltransferase